MPHYSMGAAKMQVFGKMGCMQMMLLFGRLRHPNNNIILRFPPRLSGSKEEIDHVL